MATRSISETKRVRYLLGLSSRAERDRVESEFFEDDEAFQELLAAEDDLFDAYARGDLTDEERQRFEKSFGTSQRERTLFAQAFVETLSPAKSVEVKVPGTLLNSFKVFPASRLLQSATIAVVVVLVSVLAWLVIDRRRMNDELRELRAGSAELRRQTEALQQGSDTEQKQTAGLAAQLATRRTQPDNPKHRELKPITTQPARQLPEVKNDLETISVNPGEVEPPVNRDNATLGNTFVNKILTQLPLEARNVPGLLTLEPGVTREGYAAGGRADQSNITLDGIFIDSFDDFHSYYLIPQKSSSDRNTIPIPYYFSWIRFQLPLATTAIHEEYRLTIRSAAGYPITSVDWIEPLTPNQTIIDPPVIATGELPSGEYVLFLSGKETDGSFVKVAEYLFKVIKY